MQFWSPASFLLSTSPGRGFRSIEMEWGPVNDIDNFRFLTTLIFERDHCTEWQLPSVPRVSGVATPRTTHHTLGVWAQRVWDPAEHGAPKHVQMPSLTVCGDFVGRVEARVSAGGRAHVQVEQGVVPQPVASVLQPHEYGALRVLAPLAGGRKRPHSLPRADRPDTPTLAGAFVPFCHCSPVFSSSPFHGNLYNR